MFYGVLDLIYKRHSSILQHLELPNEKLKECFDNFVSYETSLIEFIFEHGIERPATPD